MTQKEAKKLGGLYKIYWKSGGTSEAAIGRTATGKIWIAPTNWITIGVFKNYWRKISKVQKIKS